MDKVISISFGEIALKGQNRKYFEDQLIRNVKRVIKDIGFERIYKEQGKAYIEAEEVNFTQIINRIKKVFGIVNISPCIRVEREVSLIEEAAKVAVREEIEKRPIKTFKVDTSRGDKNFPIKSPDMSRNMGGLILDAFGDLRVDVHDPDLFIYIDIKQNAYIYTEKIKAYGGLPIGINGKGLLLLSGGIDSPVAGFMMAKRGLDISAVHYHSYPFTSERAEEKVKDLAEILSRYTGRIKMYSVNILEIQKAINENCDEKEMTILSRRFMMRIAERIAQREGIDGLITGESLGQVASQTIQGINATNSSIKMPVLRPLIGMDKVEIVEISKDIETYETSILPYEDCCTVFLPKHPVTRPKLEDIEKSEEALDVEGLIGNALEGMTIHTIE